MLPSGPRVTVVGTASVPKAVGGSTTKLNKIEFGEYLRAIQQWAAEDLDVYIPDPEDAHDDRQPRRTP